MFNCKVIISISMLGVFFLSSCKKYDDGPAISLRSKKERISNDWRIDKAFDNGNDVTNSFDQYEVSFSKEGSANLTAHYSFFGIDYDYTTSGTWDLENKNEKIRVDYETDAADATYFILRLKEKELRVREEGTNLELHLIPR